MLISNKSKEIVDACRFCWMCRHLCPIGNATGQERNTARARALSLSLVERGGADLDPTIVDNVYECALCGGCTNVCVTGWDPVKFTKETRNEIVITGKAPEYVEKMLGNIEKTGNIYGMTDIDADLAKAIASVSDNTDVLFFIGTDARYKAAKQAAKAVNLLKDSGIKFTVLEKEPDSGFALDFLAGAADETKSTMAACANVLNGYKTVIVYDPADAKVMLREYKEWGIDVKANIVTFTSFLADKVADGTIKAAKSDKEFFFQDPALLARDLDETEEARKVLAACGTVKEMLLNRKEVMFAGNTILNEYIENVMKKTAADRWADLKHVGGKVMVTASPSEYAVLAAVKPDDCELYSIEEVVAGC